MIPTETWVLPRPRKNKYRGGFPLHFEKKLIRGLGFDEILDREKILHPFGGEAEFGLRNDLNPGVGAEFSFNAHELKILDNQFELVIVDPPYDDEQNQKIYGGIGGKLSYKRYIGEAVRVCKPGGFVAMYHWVMTPRPGGTKYFKRIVVLTRVWHRPRVCCVFQKED